MADQTPLYNLKAVTNEVGLSPATLRAWERRYGLLKPERTPGGHRLYSRQDIEMLKWLVERQNEGLSISRAVELWNRREAESQSISIVTPTPLAFPEAGETMLGELRKSWQAACLAFDDLVANRILDQAFSLAAPELICTEVLQKGIAQIGDGWYRGQVSVQQEHFATAIATRRLNALLAAFTPPTRPEHILAACPPGEEHDFVLLLVSYLLRRGGWEVVYLGANVPLNELDDTIRDVSPWLVISTAQMLTSAASLREMSGFVTSQGVAFAYGGGIFKDVPSLTRYISGHFLGNELAYVSQAVEHLVIRSQPVPAMEPVSPAYIHSLDKFRQNEAMITNFVASMTGEETINPAHLKIANDNFSRLIAAALSLGDIGYLDQSTGWLDGLLGNYGLSPAFARQYFATFRLAVDHYLGRDGEIIHDWLTEQINAWHADKE